MRKRRRCLLTFIVAIALAVPAVGESATLERVFMPGEVIQKHAKYEYECGRCHQPFGKAEQRRLCLDCHEELAEDFKKGLGFHGRNKSARELECKRCHTEHKGRNADIVRLDRETFDHAMTDFNLKGGHIRVACASCHPARDRYRDAPSKCSGCHRDHDPHRGRLGEACADCHSEGAWSKTRFDHAKTDFSLKGKHQDAACGRCHPNGRFKKTPSDCLACHRQNDAHNGRYGGRCGQCHSPEDWKSSFLDHDKTAFPLKGAHRRAACDTCHTGRLYGAKLGTECGTCHKNDDEHRGIYGTRCGTCHSAESWKRAFFDHARVAEYPLRGKHGKVACAACHKGPIQAEKRRRACFDCHPQNDAHRGQQGKKCERCHNERGWHADVFFDHGLTRFPLIGLHAAAACEACHLAATYKDSPRECVGCHKAHDTHGRSLGPKCEQCHNPNGWTLWRFDHDSRTKFVLEGAHAGLACRSCHRRSVEREIRLPKTCFECHQEDDVHRGGFGRQCERCHGTKTFKEISLRR